MVWLLLCVCCILLSSACVRLSVTSGSSIKTDKHNITHMASGINIYSQLLITTTRITDISNYYWYQQLNADIKFIMKKRNCQNLLNYYGLYGLSYSNIVTYCLYCLCFFIYLFIYWYLCLPLLLWCMNIFVTDAILSSIRPSRQSLLSWSCLGRSATLYIYIGWPRSRELIDPTLQA